MHIYLLLLYDIFILIKQAITLSRNWCRNTYWNHGHNIKIRKIRL